MSQTYSCTLNSYIKQSLFSPTKCWFMIEDVAFKLNRLYDNKLVLRKIKVIATKTKNKQT